MRKVDETKIKAFENNCARRVLRIPWTVRITNVEVWKRLNETPELLQSIKARKLGYSGHIMRQESLSIENMIVTGLVPGNRSRGRPAMAWIDNIFEWTGLKGSEMTQSAKNRELWRKYSYHCVPPSLPMKD